MDKNIPTWHAFTNTYPGLSNRLITKARITEAFDHTTSDPASFIHVETDALWDTGATMSVITPQVVNALKLRPIGKTLIKHGGGESEQDTYIVNLILPNGVAISGVIMSELDKVIDNFGIIIGMDVISHGDFSVTNFRGKTCFSFRLPSQGTVDFVRQFNTQLKGAVPPNSTCPCGSGRKFKKCHGAAG